MLVTVYTYNGEVSEWPGILDVLQGLLEIAQLLVDDGLGLLCALDGLGLESLNGLDLPSYVVRLGLECVELLLNVVDDGLVLEDTAVIGEVNGLRLLREDGNLAARIVVALLEGLEGGGGLTLETKLRSELGPVELEGSAALWEGDKLVFLIFTSGLPLRAGLRWRRSNWAGNSFDGVLGGDMTYSDGHCDGFRRECGGFCFVRVQVQVLRESSEQSCQETGARTTAHFRPLWWPSSPSLLLPSTPDATLLHFLLIVSA